MITASNRLTLSSKSDKVEMARAIYDSVMEKIHADKVESAKAVYDSVVSMLPGELSKSLEPQLKGMTSALVNGISASEANVRAMLKSFDERLTRLEGHDKDLQNFCKATMQDVLSKQWEQLSAMLKGLPMPSVHVPEGAIIVQQLPSQVTVENIVPEQKPSVVNVVNQVPEQKAPVVSVVNQMPEQKPPDVHVNVPAAKPMEKSILYDDAGRPSIITEREVKGD